MAVTTEDSKFSGSLTEIAAAAGGALPASTEATPGPVEQLFTAKAATEPTTEPEAPVETPKQEEAAPTERIYEYKNSDGKIVKVKIGKDDTLETWVKRAKDYEQGMRKFQKERDELTKSFGDEQRQAVAKFQALQKAFKYQGIEGLINAMAGDDAAAAAYRKEIADRAIKRLDADPVELAKLDHEEVIMAERRMRELKEAELEELRKLNEQATRQANEKLLLSRLDLAFDKVRLDGRFEDSEAEEYHNQVIWDKTLSNLEKIANTKGVEEHELSPQVIHAEFKRVADLHLKGLNLQAEKVATKKIEQTKEEALKTAQSIVSKGAAGSLDVGQLAEAHMKNYDGLGFLRSVLGKMR